ncbi:peptide deformylase, mitochondrial-like [Pararge aegeria]|uniref:Peptide deformylase n=1 Tax=Pararge aegeria aegeria TaxID=348720 RepID=A0A8S4S278_9NEOP|nr:peptide deformylase, mitochondrial-like [Pararge aegeria]CAH2243688.1 jg26159 [Pararge aegeria aegeria]
MGVIRKTLNWYARLSPSHGISPPPYKHVVQIGDPTLRRVSESVSLEKIRTKEIQGVIEKLKQVMYRYGSVGMAAPQVGVNLRIFVMRLTDKQISDISAEVIKDRDITAVPYTVYVNPQLKVVDYQKVVHPEGCESIKFFKAEVARYNAVQITGYNPEGESICQLYKGWAARIAQHEMDHLDGKLYTDIMDRKSLCCTLWEEVNMAKGKVAIPFSPE